MSTADPNSGGPERELFIKALEQPTPAAQGAFLDEACGTDTTLRRRLDLLLRRFDDIGTFMAEPAAGPNQPGDSPPNAPSAPEPAGTVPPTLTEQLGDTIGRYKLLEKLGEGGFGVVYMAQQREPVKRRVALKIIKMGMDTKEVLARFEAERQALALMDHPNIAKILDGGVVGSAESQNSNLKSQIQWGRPYFVMELVRGVRITDFCDQRQLGLKERLELFVQVCQAVQHAHQKGVIHRDLKPSNILVTLNEPDGPGVPKIIDFGIAKATQQELTEKTLFTAYGQFLGTPAYMSPEQAVLTNLDVDTRSDIYSLGVLLYELLTGKPPFDTRELLQVGFDELCRTLREVEPPRPSTRLSTMAGDALAGIAKSRQTDAPKLVHHVRGDLDWIVMKCLEKDRARRYETANGLAADLQRHLHNEPVVARPPSAGYRLAKLARRNKLAFWAGAIIAAVLVLATAVSAWQARLAREAERKADAKATAERAAREESETIAKFLTEVFQSPDPARSGRTITVAETLDAAAKKLDIDLAAQPARRAQLRLTLGSTYRALSLHREAIPLQEQAVDYYRATFGPNHLKTLGASHELALSYADAGRHHEALKLQEEVLARTRERLGSNHRDTLSAMNALAGSYLSADRLNEALQMQEEVLALQRKLSGPEHPATLKAMNDLALLYSRAGRLGEAIQLQEEVLTLQRKVNGPEHPETLLAMCNLSFSYSHAGRLEEAIRLAEQVLPRTRTINGPEHRRTIDAMNALALAYSYSGRRDEALKLQEEVLALQRKVIGPERPATLRAMNDLAVLYSRAARLDEAIQLQEEVLKLQRKVNGPEHSETLLAMSNLALGYVYARRLEEATRLAEEVLPVMRTVHGPEHRNTISAMNTLGLAYAYAGRRAEALELQEVVLALQRKVAGSEHPNTLTAMQTLAHSYLRAGRTAEELQLRMELLASARKSSADNPAAFETRLAELAETHSRQNQYALVEPLYRELLHNCRSRAGTDDGKGVGVATASLGGVLSEWAWAERGTNARASYARAREAESLIRESLSLAEDQTNISRAFLGDNRSRLGGAILTSAITDSTLATDARSARFAEAEGFLRSGEGLTQRSTSSSVRQKRDGIERLVRLYTAWDELGPNTDQAAKAAEWKQKLMDFDTAATNTQPAGAEP